MQEKLKAITVRVDSRVWRRLGQLAQQDKRPVASYLRIILADFVSAKQRADKPAAGSERVAA